MVDLRNVKKGLMPPLAVAFLALCPAASAADHALRHPGAEQRTTDHSDTPGSPTHLFRQFLHWLERK